MRELSAEMGSDELALWIAFDGLYGLGDGHTVVGQLGNAIVRGNGAKSAKPEHFAPILKPDQAARGNTPAQNQAAVRSIFAARKARNATCPPSPSTST